MLLKVHSKNVFPKTNKQKKQNQTEPVRERRVVPNVRLWRQENELKRHEFVSKNNNDKKTQKQTKKRVRKAIVKLIYSWFTQLHAAL